MIESDFPVLREAVNDSAIGRSVQRLVAATATAASEATVTRYVSSLRSSFSGDAAATVRSGGITLAVAALAAWGFSQFVPPYVATGIPGAAFLTFAVLSGLAAVRPEFLARQWQSSRLRRLKTW